MPTNEGRRPDRPRAPSAPPRLGASYRIWRLTHTAPFDGFIACRRPVAVWVHWDGRRDVWCYGPGADLCLLCKDLGAKWTSWVLAQQSVARGLWALQVSRAAAVNEATGLWVDGNADLYGQAIDLRRVRSGPQGAMRVQLGGLSLAPRRIPLRTDLVEWVRRLYDVADNPNVQGGADQFGTAPQ